MRCSMLALHHMLFRIEDFFSLNLCKCTIVSPPDVPIRFKLLRGMASNDAHPNSYLESNILTIIVRSSFLLVLDIDDNILDRIAYCGLIGQILVGVAWGAPGIKLLPNSVEETAVQLGYLCLLMIFHKGHQLTLPNIENISYQAGGLSTIFASLKIDFIPFTIVAIADICAPIVLALLLQYFAYASLLRCFAAGAASCSTSLGMMFTLLRISGLPQSAWV